MRTLLSITILIIVLSGCYKDSCETTISYYANVPVYGSLDSVRNAVEVQAPREVDTPEKLYFKDNYIFLVESAEGIHIINNNDPASPQSEKFIQIPGNHDLAIQDHFLYADSYSDLLVFDVSDLENIVLIERVENVFDYYGNYYFLSSEDPTQIVTDFRSELVEQHVTDDCDGSGGFLWFGGQGDDLATLEQTDALGSSGSGTGGSMARFTIIDDHMYTVDHYSIRPFDLSTPSKPVAKTPLDIGWDIETVFPYNEHLFIGSRTGMHIYSVANPGEPVFTSLFSHVNACDPVVVANDIAYVTLRGGTECETFTNQLEIIDVSDVSNPQLIKTYPMQNPHGLGVQNNCLYICEGEFGLKYFDLIGKDSIKLNKHFTDMHALDVIPIDNRLFMIGGDGFYQYEGLCTPDLLYLSQIGF